MQATGCRYLSALRWCLLAALLSGCAAQSGGWNWFGASGTRSAEQVAATPGQRIADLRTLAATAAKSDAAEQERISTTLAESARSELDPLVRAQTVRTLGACQTATARAALAASLADATADVRIAACEALAKSGGPDAVRLLSGTVANDTDFDVRMAAIRGLGELGDPAAVSGLGVALEDPNPAMQRRAVESLARVTGRSYGNDVDAWRLYVQGKEPQPKPVSFAERFRRLF